MRQPPAYIDTSAFIKRYLSEQGTDEIEAFVMSDRYRMLISSLTVTEFRSVLRQRQRRNLLDANYVARACEQLSVELGNGSLAFQVVDGAIFNLAGDLLERLHSPLGTQDALHLACARTAGCELMVSADRQLLAASMEAGLQTLALSPA